MIHYGVPDFNPGAWIPLAETIGKDQVQLCHRKSLID
jgi:hypothetical protein